MSDDWQRSEGPKRIPSHQGLSGGTTPLPSFIEVGKFVASLCESRESGLASGWSQIAAVVVVVVVGGGAGGAAAAAAAGGGGSGGGGSCGG